MRYTHLIFFATVLFCMVFTITSSVRIRTREPIKDSPFPVRALQNAANIELISQLEGSFSRVKVDGDYAYVQDSKPSSICFKIIDISDQTNPVEIGLFSTRLQQFRYFGLIRLCTGNFQPYKGAIACG